MKNKKILILATSIILSFGAFAFTSCGESEKVTKIDVIAASSITVNEEIEITCDVIGTENDEVIFTSLTPEILEVTAKNKVKGLKPGEGKIKIVSKVDTSVSKVINIIVNDDFTSEINIKIESNEVTFDKATNKYIAPLGHEFKLTYESKAGGDRIPDSVNFEIVTSESSDASIQYINLENFIDQNDIRKSYAICLPMAVAESVAIRCVVAYGVDNSNVISSTIVLDVVDKHLDYVTEIKNKLLNSSTIENEGTRFVSAKINKTLDGVTTKEESHAYLNNKNIYFSNDEYYFGGINNKSYYNFKYTLENSKVNILTINDSQIATDDNKNSAKLPLFINGTNDLHGFGNSVYTKFFENQTVSSNFATFGNAYAYANMEVTKEANSYKIVSSFDIEESTYNLSLDLKFNEKVLVGYKFISELSHNTTENFKGSSTKYEEGTIEDAIYDARKEFTNGEAGYFDFSDLFFNSITLEDLTGKKDPNDEYNYQDKNKYGAESHEVEGDMDVFTLKTNKSLPLKVFDEGNSSANAGIDVIQVTGDNKDLFDDITLTRAGILNISAKYVYDKITGKYVYQTGETILTFKSTNTNATKKIKVIFTEFFITDVEMDASQDSKDTFKDGETIRVGKKSGYFIVKLTPDESTTSFTYRIEVVKGDKDGIKLYDYEDGNIAGITGMAYAIEGVKAGEYEFRLFIDELPNVKSKIYKINVLEPLSNDEIASKIVGKRFGYETTGGTSSYIEFKTENKFIYEEVTNYGTSSKTGECDYKIENGKILVEKDITLSSLSGDSFYYSKIKAGEFVFDDNFDNLSFIVEKKEVESGQITTSILNLAKIMCLKDFKEYLIGKDATFFYPIFANGMSYKVKLTFISDSKAKIELIENGGTTIGQVINFDYEIKDGQYGVVLSMLNIEGLDPKFVSTISGDELSVSIFNKTIKGRFTCGSSTEQVEFKF